MIELLGAGVQGPRGEWLLHGVRARLERGTLYDMGVVADRGVAAR